MHAEMAPPGVSRRWHVLGVSERRPSMMHAVVNLPGRAQQKARWSRTGSGTAARQDGNCYGTDVARRFTFRVSYSEAEEIVCQLQYCEA